MWFASIKEVGSMIEQALVGIINILFFALIGESISTFALIIAIVIMLSKE